jgi:hypothetical protein
MKTLDEPVKNLINETNGTLDNDDNADSNQSTCNSSYNSTDCSTDESSDETDLEDETNNLSQDVSPVLLNKLNFDFYQAGQNIFDQRREFYDSLIADALKAEFRENSFIAKHDFFISKEGEKSTKVDIYISRENSSDYSKVLNNLIDVINPNYRDQAAIECEFERIIKFQNQMGYKVQVHVSDKNLHSTLNQFKYETFKIAYKYRGDRLYVSNWYALNIGFKKPYDFETEDEKFKNIRSYDI